MDIDFSLSKYIFPQPPVLWDAEAILVADEIAGPVQTLSVALRMIGALGALITGYKCLSSLFRTVSLPPAMVAVGSASAVMYVCGQFLKNIAISHYEGLSDEQRLAIGIEELKKAWDLLPICKTEDELEEKLQTDPGFNAYMPHTLCEKANALYSLCSQEYHPIKQLQPCFNIHKQLAIAEQQDLLNKAYSKGIVLTFSEYSRHLFGKVPVLSKEIDEVALGRMQKGFECAVEFLKKRLQEQGNIDCKAVNAQLSALAFRWTKADESVQFLNPTVFVEDEETLILRGNCSEIGNPAWAVDLLAPSFKQIKIELRGLLFVDEFYLPENWQAFQEVMHQKHPGKLIFVDQLEGQLGQVFQPAEGLPFQNKVTLSDLWEDAKRCVDLEENLKEGP